MKNDFLKKIFFFLVLMIVMFSAFSQVRSRILFTKDWKFKLADDSTVKNIVFDDSKWRTLNLPHDWSIEFPFDSASPTGNGGGALRGGLAWYRKTFTLSEDNQSKNIFIDFDGVYKNSEVWINGHYLGKRPNGYISFEYDLTPYLKFGKEKNIIAVKVDNSKQPNSRWYSGSGIYRNVWLVTKAKISVDQWGTFISTPQVTNSSASVVIKINVVNQSSKNKKVKLETTFLSSDGKEVAKTVSDIQLANQANETEQKAKITNPILWSDEHPYLYKAITKIISDEKIVDVYETTFGIRYFKFDANKGFFLNGKHVKIKGVCDHHDLGCLGTAINKRALERQLEILKEMGCNAIRTSHNPPAPELLELADKMGFIIMDEAFDMWKKEKTTFDYHLDWDEWHVKDLKDQILRDRNHPSVFIWSVGNEIMEQWNAQEDSTPYKMLKELNDIVKSLDTSRPTVTANNEPSRWNKLLQANVTDLIGYNYAHARWNRDSVTKLWGNKPFILTETISALETRSHYDRLRSDSIRQWPGKHWDDPCNQCNADLTVNAYDNVSAGWGSTHEVTMKLFQKNDFISGEFIWTGFDYIGEPTPYQWPARSSYFGIIDLAGFPKDVYYMYQSVWTDKTVLHILPHWNWKTGDTVDVWAYYNHADEVELFLNEKSLGTKKKIGDDLHVMWRVPFVAGTLKAVSKKDGKTVLTKEIKTAGRPAKIELIADRKNIKADGKDLSFITARIVDAAGNIVPDADTLIQFASEGNAEIIGTDNGLQTSMESFKGNQRKAFNGLALVVLQSKEKAGKVILKASSKNLASSSIEIVTQ